MNNIKKYKIHDNIMEDLERKKRIAKLRREENLLKKEIFLLKFPFSFKIKFNKLIVLLSIAAIVSYTIAAISLQKYNMIEISPTLTTCVYAFFGTELLSLAGIRIFDSKYEIKPTEIYNESAVG